MNTHEQPTTPVTPSQPTAPTCIPLAATPPREAPQGLREAALKAALHCHDFGLTHPNVVANVFLAALAPYVTTGQPVSAEAGRDSLVDPAVFHAQEIMEIVLCGPVEEPNSDVEEIAGYIRTKMKLVPAPLHTPPAQASAGTGTPTPETDEAADRGGLLAMGKTVPAKFARRLEQQRDTARQQLAEARAEGERLAKERDQIAEARSEYVEELRGQLAMFERNEENLRTLASELAGALEMLRDSKAGDDPEPIIAASEKALLAFRSSTPAPAPAPDKLKKET